MDKKQAEAEFVEFILGIQQGAWMSLGKIMNPLTQKAEKSLPHVKAMIDTLLMLKEKTKSNLSSSEERLLDDIIVELQVNYVDEVKKEKDEAATIITGKQDETNITENKEN